MHQDILSVAVAVFEHPDQLNDFRVNAMHAKFQDSSLTSLTDRFFNLLFGFFDNFFHPAGMNPAIRNKPA